MPNMTLAIPIELKEKMEQFKEINWSEVARRAIWEKTKILEHMNKLLSKSRLTEVDIERHADVIKRNVLRKHRGNSIAVSR